MKRPGLPRPWRWHLPWRPRRAASGDAAEVSQERSGHEEDLRLLRRTRLRLMGVSGLVTLVILVALGMATYVTVSNRVEDSALAQLNSIADPHSAIHNTSGFDFTPLRSRSH